MGILPWKKQTPQKRQPQLMDGQDSYVFRRSRTLTGTTSSQVTPTAGNRGQLKTDRLKLHELKAHRRRLFKALLGVLALVGGATFLLLNVIFALNIAYPQPSAGQPSTVTYQESVREYFADHPFERFGFALRTAEFEAFMKTKHTELRSISVSRAWYGGEVAFSFYFREPLLVWQSNGQKFFVDDEGIAFGYNHFKPPAVVVTDQSGIPPTSDGAIVSGRFMQFLGRLVGAINGYSKGRVVSVGIPASTRQIDVKLEGREYIIKTHIDRDPLYQAEDIANALGYFDAKAIKPEYVDVRVAHKAYYK